MEILILDLDTIYRRLEDLHNFLDGFIFFFFLSMSDYEYIVGAFHKHPDFLKKVSPYLYSLAPAIDTILRIEDKEERKKELKRIQELTRGEINRLWDNLGETIINSYEDLIYDITGSKEIREICKREVTVPFITRGMKQVKKEKYEWAEWLNDVLLSCITELFREIERLAMGGG